MQHHKYSLTELEAMVPWEREIYVQLLANYVKEESDKAQLLEAQRKSKRRTRR